MADLESAAVAFYDDEKSAYRFSLQSLRSALSSPSESVTKEDEELLKERDSQAQHTERNLEAQISSTPAEYSVSTVKKLLYLALYFLLNLAVTLSNKGLLQAASYPWLLTFNHTFSTSIGCTLLLLTGRLRLTKLSWRENLTLVAFSTLFTLNIAISNVSLSLVSVPFHQIVRSMGPVVTIFLYRLIYNRTYSTETYLSMIPLITGVALATYGDYYSTVLGFLLTFLGIVLASTKSIIANRLMTGSLNLSAMEVLVRMSPLAALQCLLYAFGSGELGRMQIAASEGLFTSNFLFVAICNAAMAFGLNFISFQTNKIAGALTVSVCGNVKQCLTILLGIILFSVRVAPLNGLGMVIAVAGAAYYSKVELARKRGAS